MSNIPTVGPKLHALVPCLGHESRLSRLPQVQNQDTATLMGFSKCLWAVQELIDDCVIVDSQNTVVNYITRHVELCSPEIKFPKTSSYVVPTSFHFFWFLAHNSRKPSFLLIPTHFHPTNSSPAAGRVGCRVMWFLYTPQNTQSVELCSPSSYVVHYCIQRISLQKFSPPTAAIQSPLVLSILFLLLFWS